MRFQINHPRIYSTCKKESRRNVVKVMWMQRREKNAVENANILLYYRSRTLYVYSINFAFF